MSSNTLIDAAFELNFSELGLSPTQSLLLLIICSRADEDDLLFCSTSHLADACNCSRPVVSSGLKRLSSLGLIEIIKSGGFASRNRYRVMILDRLFDREPTPVLPLFEDDSVLPNQNEIDALEFLNRTKRTKPSSLNSPVSGKRAINRKKRKAKKKK